MSKRKDRERAQRGLIFRDKLVPKPNVLSKEELWNMRTPRKEGK